MKGRVTEGKTRDTGRALIAAGLTLYVTTTATRRKPGPQYSKRVSHTRDRSLST